MLVLDFLKLMETAKIASVDYCRRKCNMSRQSVYNHVRALKRSGYNIKIENGIVIFEK